MRKEKLDELLLKPVEVHSGVVGVERPKSLCELVEEDFRPLARLANHHIVSSRQFDRDQLAQLCRLAATYESMPELLHKPLSGKLMITAFYEPSTRTRLSFESAWHRLGGDVIPITDPSSTAMAKGESLQDMAEMFSNYGDLMVLRDSDEKAVYEMMKALRIPIVNAGNGIDEHPTQALADLYTLSKWKPEILLAGRMQKKIKVGIIGSPCKMRTLRSLLLLLTLVSDAVEEVAIINGQEQTFDPDQMEELKEAGLRISVHRKAKRILGELDVIYINSIAWVGDTFEELAQDITLSSRSPLKPESIILHPLARGAELHPDLDATPHNWYFAQSRGAVFIRMALLTSVVQRLNLVIDAPYHRVPVNVTNKAA